MIPKALKITFLVCLFGGIIVALVGGMYTFPKVPPYPARIVDASGAVLAEKADIMRGQANFQRYGLMDVGSVWGHGTYRGTEFTANTLHRIGQEMRAYYQHQGGAPVSDLDATVIAELRENRYDHASGTLQLTAAESYAFTQVIQHWNSVFSDGDKPSEIMPGAIADPADRAALGAFFFWTAWASGTLRPGDTMTYTNNWPPDRSVGNELSPNALLWTIVSLIAFMAFLVGVVAIFHTFGIYGKAHDQVDIHAAKKLSLMPTTPSQVKAAKYFLVVIALFFLQTIMGGLMAHYTVHPGQFYGMDWLAKVFPYTWAKTWHLQAAVFWIAVAWIGSTIYIAPIVGGREPKYQGLLVDLLFVAAALVLVGSFTGEVLGVKGLAGPLWFWLGHQGWEYLELGRLWQILLLVGLVLWLVIVVRGIAPALKGDDRWGLPHFLMYSGLAVVGFFAFGLFYNPQTHLSIADFWRWWVVHTWVEGAFEFFAAAAIATMSVLLGLVTVKDALKAAYFTAALAVGTGIIGVGHHYYWFGAPSFWFALGGVISALEPVPILLLLGKSWQEYRAIKKVEGSFPYFWPLMFTTASAIWATIGAGIFGFLITTPVVNYFEHSTYLTVNHGHTALFGTYGTLAIGLTIFALRGLTTQKGWLEKFYALSWYGLNIGLFLMAFVTLLPVGIRQTIDSYRNGLWHARSPEFYADPVVQFFGQIRLIPDLMIILFGVVPLGLAILWALFNLKKAGSETPVQVEEKEAV